jgi:hypothetical protein
MLVFEGAFIFVVTVREWGETVLVVMMQRW